MIYGFLLSISPAQAVIGYVSRIIASVRTSKAPGTGPAPRLDVAGRNGPDPLEIVCSSQSRDRKAAGEMVLSE